MGNLCSHCLRPAFTRRLLRDLERGVSLNLVGESGRGRKRLLEDLSKAAPNNVQIFYADMGHYKGEYAGFIRELGRQAQNAGLLSSLPKDESDLFHALENSRKSIFLLLHNFDALFYGNDPDSHYDRRFFDNLNKLHSLQHISLVCVTRKPQNTYAVFTGKKTVPLWLNLQQEHLPLLKETEIRDEINRRLQRPDDQAVFFLLKAVQGHAHCYDLLTSLCIRLQKGDDPQLSAENRLRKWKYEFDRLSTHATNLENPGHLPGKLLNYLKKRVLNH